MTMERMAVDVQAADWLLRLEHPEVKEEEIQSWLEWFGASDANRRAFEELRTLRGRFRGLTGGMRGDLRGKLALAPATTTRRVFTAPIAWAASLLGIALAVSIGWKLHGAGREIVYSAPTHHHRAVALEDGSQLVLAADAVVSVSYSKQRRALDIEQGEAYFEVRQVAQRPFVVRAGPVRVTALGTAFHVQRRSDEVVVTVTEGRVAVGSREGERLLAMGQKVVVSLSAVSSSARDQTASPPLWDNDRADFADARLSDIIPLVNQYGPTRVVIDDPRVADLTYSGTIFRRHIDEWIASLPQVYPVRAVPLEDGSVSLVSRETRAK